LLGYSVPVSARLRPLTPEDAASVASISAFLGDAEDQESWRCKLEALTDCESAAGVGVEVQGALVGYIIGHVVHEGGFGIAEATGFLESVGVHPAWQGREIARSLAEALFEELAERGARRVLTLVKPGEDRLQPFFRSIGFRPLQLLCLERKI
jgi:ribosomal protein S18 acetylase RimI-like enzyme